MTMEEAKKISDYFRNEYKELEQEPCEDCISREEVLNILKREGHKYAYGEWIDAIRDVNILPSVKPKVDADALINKIETELSWSMYDDWGNSTSLHDGLVDIIKEWAERNGEG